MFGGLPSGEYLIHVLSSFGMGMAVAAYILVRPTLPLPPPTGVLQLQVQGMLAVGSILFVAEILLFVRTLAAAPRENRATVARFE